MWIVFSLQTGILVGQMGRLLEWRFCLPLGALVVVLTLGVWAIIRVKRWRQDFMEEKSSPRERLDDYQNMIAEGLLHPEEFARIKARMDPRPSQPDASAPNNPPTDFPAKPE